MRYGDSIRQNQSISCNQVQSLNVLLDKVKDRLNIHVPSRHLETLSLSNQHE